MVIDESQKCIGIYWFAFVLVWALLSLVNNRDNTAIEFHFVAYIMMI